MNYTLPVLHEQLIKRHFQATSIIYNAAMDAKNLNDPDPSFRESTIHSFRFSAIPDKPESNALYLYEQSTDTVTLHHNSFSFNVKGVYNRICEAVIDICRHLDKWEHDLYETAWNKGGYQEMIDRSDEIFCNPIFLCNWQGNVHGFSKAYESVDYSETWHSITHDRKVPVSSLTALMDSDFRSYLSQENKVHYLEFKDLGHKSIFGLIHENSNIVLQFQIMSYNRPVTDADLYLAQIFLNAIRRLFQNVSMTTQESSQGLFIQLLNEDSVSEDALIWALDYMGWQDPSSSYNLLVFRSRSGDACEDEIYAQIERHFPGCLVLAHDGNMIMLISSVVLKRSIREMNYVLNSFRLYGGVSLSFSDWFSLPDRYSQALLALEHCTRDMPLCFGLSYAWNYLIQSVTDKMDGVDLLHPAAATLIEYDKENDTQLADTLYKYLMNERSNVETASCLFIHRNTLKYRLEKIYSLIDADLEDFNTRMHLIVSFQSYFKDTD